MLFYLFREELGGFAVFSKRRISYFLEKGAYLFLILFCILIALDLILSQFTSVSLMEDTEIGWKMQHSYVDAIIAPNAAKYTNFSELS